MPLVAFRVSTTNCDCSTMASIIVAGMVGDNHHRVILAEILERSVGHIQVVVAASAHGGKVRVVVGHDGAFIAQQFDNRQRRRFAQVVDVPFVGQPQYQHLRSPDGLRLPVEPGAQSAQAQNTAWPC